MRAVWAFVNPVKDWCSEQESDGIYAHRGWENCDSWTTGKEKGAGIVFGMIRLPLRIASFSLYYKLVLLI